MPHITDLKLVPFAFHMKGVRSPFPSVSSASEAEVCAVTVDENIDIRSTAVETAVLR